MVMRSSFPRRLTVFQDIFGFAPLSQISPALPKKSFPSKNAASHSGKLTCSGPAACLLVIAQIQGLLSVSK